MTDLLNVVWRARKESDIQKILSCWIRQVPLQSKESRETLTVLIIPWAKEIFRLTKKPFKLLYIKSIVDGLYSPPFHVMEKLGRGVYTMRILDSEVIDLSHHLHQTWEHMSSDQYADCDAVYVSESNTQIPGYHEWLGNLCADLCDAGKTIITDFYSSRSRVLPSPTTSPSSQSTSNNNSTARRKPPSPAKKFRLGSFFSRKRSTEDSIEEKNTDTTSEPSPTTFVPYLRGRFETENYYPFSRTDSSDTALNCGIVIDKSDQQIILKGVHEISFGDDETETETETETDMETESSDTSVATAPSNSGGIKQHFYANLVSNTRTINSSSNRPPNSQHKVPSDEKLVTDEDGSTSHQRMIWKSLVFPNLSSHHSSSSSSFNSKNVSCDFAGRDELLTRRVIIPIGAKWVDGVPFIAIRTDKNGLVITLNGKFDENAGANGGLISAGAHQLLLNCCRMRKRDLTPLLSMSGRRTQGRRKSTAGSLGKSGERMARGGSVGTKPKLEDGSGTMSMRSISAFSDLEEKDDETQLRQHLSHISENLFPSLGVLADDELPESPQQAGGGIDEDDGDDDDDDDDGYGGYESGPPTPPGMGSSSDFPPQFGGGRTGGFSRQAHQFEDEDSDDILDAINNFEFDDDDPWGVGGDGMADAAPKAFRPPTLFRLPAI